MSTRDLAGVTALISRHLDTTLGPLCASPRELGWERIGKIAEEYGEVTEAWIGTAGTNPRKGQTHSVAEVREELLDVALCALGAYEHVTGNAASCGLALYLHAISRAQRMGLLEP